MLRPDIFPITSLTLIFVFSLVALGLVSERRRPSSAMTEVENGHRAVAKDLAPQQWRSRPISQRRLDDVMPLTSAVQ